MPYLVDSDWAIDYLGNDPAAVSLLTHLAPDGLAISIITYMEAYQGTLDDPDPAAAAEALEQFVAAGVPIVAISPAVARRCAQLRRGLGRAGRRMRLRALDLLVAATALEHDLTLVIRNRDDYRDIPGLRLHPNR